MATPKIRPLIPTIPINEQRGAAYAQDTMQFIAKHKGRYLRDEAGHPHVVVDGRRISLDLTPDNYELARLLVDACNVSTVSPAARAAIQRLQIEAVRKAGKVRFRRFSALSADKSILYVPLACGQLLQVSAEGFTCTENGENPDHIWLEHPRDEALQHSSADTAALDCFERLLVETQACSIPSMRWLVAMHLGFFPFIRDSCPARLLLELIGSAQQGKTSGAQRFSFLHGLGPVKGDYTVAALAALGDIGLLILDNKEQANFTQPLLDFCLFLATGADRGRSETNGQLRTGDCGRPAGVITTIEGVLKTELRARCIEVQYGVAGPKLPRGPIEDEINARRHEIGSAMVQVFPRYFEIRKERRPTPNPIPEFEEHFTALGDLLRAYGEVAGKGSTWAEPTIAEWNDVLGKREPEESELEHKLRRAVDEGSRGILDRAFPNVIPTHAVDVAGRKGIVYVTECGPLLTALQILYPQDRSLPQAPAGLGKRLRSERFLALAFLDEDSSTTFPFLHRTAGKRPIGIFVPV